MDITVFNEAKKAYAAGDYNRALAGFSLCARQVGDLPDEELSKFYHLVGNCFVRCGSPSEAAQYYAKALKTCSPERRPSLYVNLGTALLGADRDEDAIKSFTAALGDSEYPTPYKAYSGIGAAQLKLGDMVEAGAAYREAALDPANPNPGKALINLGVCFMELDRTDDAVVSYEAALDMGLSPKTAGKAYSNLGQAYMTQGRLADAIASFEAALDGGTELSPIASHDLSIARTLQKRFGDDLSAIAALPAVDPPALLEEPADDGIDYFDEGEATWPAEYGYDPDEDYVEGADEPAADEPAGDEPASPAAATGEIDPSANTLSFPAVGEDDDDAIIVSPADTFTALDALDADEAPMPSPEDTAFFDISEDDINAAAEGEKKKKKTKKGRRVWPKVLIGIVIVLVLLAAACAAGYMLGYGYPSQEQVTEQLVDASRSGESADGLWASSVSAEARATQEVTLSSVASYDVVAVERSASRTIVYLDATLQDGGKMYYDVTLGRDKLSWAVESIDTYFPSKV